MSRTRPLTCKWQHEDKHGPDPDIDQALLIQFAGGRVGKVLGQHISHGEADDGCPIGGARDPVIHQTHDENEARDGEDEPEPDLGNESMDSLQILLICEKCCCESILNYSC